MKLHLKKVLSLRHEDTKGWYVLYSWCLGIFVAERIKSKFPFRSDWTLATSGGARVKLHEIHSTKSAIDYLSPQSSAFTPAFSHLLPFSSSHLLFSPPCTFPLPNSVIRLLSSAFLRLHFSGSKTRLEKYLFQSDVPKKPFFAIKSYKNLTKLI